MNGRNSFGNCFIHTIESTTVLFVAKFGQELTELGRRYSFSTIEISRRRARKMEATMVLLNGKGTENGGNNIGK